jgi:hypothetical protein
MKRLKKALVSATKGFKKLMGEAKEKVDIDSHFSRLAQKWDRISTGMVKLNPTFLGIFDRVALTLTIRAEVSLKKGELIETEHVQYRIEEIRPDLVQLPLEIEHVTHLIPCRVAVLAKI